MMRHLAATLCFACVAFVSTPVRAQETTTFSYDTLGRLTGSTISGSTNDGTQTSTQFDPAGNRTNYSVNGVAAPSLAISGPSPAVEGNALVFTVTRTGGTASTVGVSYATANGTATAGSDYTAASGTLSFAPGETVKTFSVTTIDDSAIESSETVLANLSGATGGATISTTQATGTITDNDIPPVSFAISGPAAVTEGGTLVYTVTKTGTNASNISVNYASAGGTATSGSDFTAVSGTLTFTPTDTTKTISVVTIDDSTTESSETVLVDLSGATGGATISTAQASGAINDNDAPAVSLAISGPAPVVEGGTLVYTVNKTGTNASNISVNYASGSVTATAASDYTAVSGTLTFAPADTTKTISITTIDDSASESPETVQVTLSSPTGGATISTAQASGTINDNDGGLITLTDSFLGVVPAHSSVYGCSVQDYNNILTEEYYTVRQCWLKSNNHSVYYESNQPSNPQYTLAPGYSFGFGNVLKVQSAYYGTAP